MNARYALTVLGLLAGVLSAAAAPVQPKAQAKLQAPLSLAAQYELAGAPSGHFDHLAIDQAGQRLFSTDEGGAIEVVSLATGKVIHTIAAKEPHGILYRADLNRLYVTDGGVGALLIFDGKTLKQIGSVKLWDDADSVGYDPTSHYLYVDSGGGDLKETFSHFSIVDTTAGKLVADMKIDGDTIEAMQLARNSPLIYLNIRSKGQIAVIDRNQRKVVANWPIHGATVNVAMALDEADHRLFVGCRSGQMVIFDTANGKQLQSLPLTKGVDDMIYDRASRRIYAAADGATDVFRQAGPDQYRASQVKTATLGKTALLVPALHRYFIAVPAEGAKPARILAMRVN